MTMLVPLTVSRLGTSMFRPAMSIRNLPGTLKAEAMLPPSVIAARAVAMFTLTSNVPSSPVTSAVTPLPPWLSPKLSAARLTPMAMVRTSSPPSKPTLARPTEGPSNVNGPRAMGLVAEAASLTWPETVKVALLATLAMALLSVPTVQLLATNCTLISPSTKVWSGVTPALGCTKKR